ncbi:MAG: TipAS antibiotic-recognition domain-containing protein [Thermoleophilia bacterium]|nr:TipAS antibiotic-recognition domain-containing protein [Thermoleophilia bacterium]
MSADRHDIDPFERPTRAEGVRRRTDARRPSSRRTATYTPEQWRTIQAESSVLTDRFAQLFDDGSDPASQAVLAASAAWRQHVDRWFYQLTPEVQRGLGELYVADPRFVAYYEGDETQRAGYALWMRDAFAAYADSRE